MFKPRALGKAFVQRASSKVLEALTRADELGGQLRDQVSEKLAELSAAQKAARSAAARPVAVPVAVPTATAKAPPAGLGDPARAVQIFGRASCPWSGRAVALIKRAGIDYAYFDLEAYGAHTFSSELKAETQQDTVPYVYVRGRFIGGYDALDELERLGHLEYLVLPEAERVRHPMHGRIEVLPRRHVADRNLID